MTPVPVRLALRRTLSQIRHVRPVLPRAATGTVRMVYQQVERDFGMLAPPVALHSPAPVTLAASWTLLRETLVAADNTSRATREVVAAEVSARNTCPYCVEVHTAALTGVADRADATAFSAGRPEVIGDPLLRAAVSWARETGDLRRFPAAARAELIGVAVTFEYLNRMVNVFLGDSPLPGELPAPARRKARGLLARVLRPSRTEPRRGDSLSLLPPAALPADLAWAAGDAIVADAFARASAGIEAAGRATLPHSVRTVVRAALSEWDGRPPALGRDWLRGAVSGLPTPSEKDLPMIRLALLSAMASYQVDDGVVADFRRVRPGDRSLVDVVAWSSFSGARRRGELLAGTAREEKTAVPGRPEN